MKVISVDNFDREIIGTSDDSLVCTAEKKAIADLIALLLNKWAGKNSDRFYRVEDDSYVLRKYEP